MQVKENKSHLQVEYELRVRNYGRSISDQDWRVIDTKHKECWNEASNILSAREVNLDEFDLHIHYDWAPIIRKFDRYLSVMREIDKSRGMHDKLEIALGKFPKRSSKIKIYTDVTHKKPDTKFGLIEGAIESSIYDIFLMMNLASPGSADFYLSNLVGVGSKRGTDISLSNYFFEAAHLDGWQGKFPALTFLELRDVIDWYDSIRNGMSQIPNTSIEKAIFAVFNIVRLEITPLATIWIFYALEVLYDTKPGENFRMLCERIRLVLEIPDGKFNDLKRHMRKLYDYRSSIVHGGLEVFHPMLYEPTDSRVQTKIAESLSHADFGFRIVICTLQKCIQRSWRDMKFHEKVEGVGI